MKESIKPPVEVRYQKELAALKAADTARRPGNWRLSPRLSALLFWEARNLLSIREKPLPSVKNTSATTPWWSAALSPWPETED